MMFRLIVLALTTIACTQASKNTTSVRVSPRQSAVSQTMPVYRISRDVYRTTPSPHHGDHLALGVPFEPIRALKSQIEAREGAALIDRGEAHLTVITPLDFSRLKSKMTMADIEWLARTNGFYEAKFMIACLGRATKGQDKTYFLVVTSPELLNLRRIIAQEFQVRGGAAEAFRAESFTPHVTVAFIGRDLHEADGAVKDATSCIASVKVGEGVLTQ